MTVEIKGLTVYTFADKSIAQKVLETITGDVLAEKEFVGCGKHDAIKMGFTPFESGEFTMKSGDNTLIQVTIQQKKPKASKVKHMCKIKEQEYMKENDVEKLDKDTKTTIKTLVIEELLPETFPDNEVTTVLWIKDDKLIVGCPTQKKSEELVSFVRAVIGSIPVSPLVTKKEPLDVMADMVLSKYNETLTLGSYVELEPVEEGATMKFSKELVSNMDIAKHIETKINGELTEISFVTKLELDYEGTVFRLNDKLEVSSVKVNKEFTLGKKDEGALLVSIAELNNAVGEVIEVLGGVYETS